MKRFRWLGLLAGVALFAWVLRSADLPVVWEQLRNLGGRFGLILLFYIVIFGLDTLGWRFALPPAAQRRVGWAGLFRTRLAGEAINYVTPTAWVGGEPVKAYLLSRRYGIPLGDGMTSVVIAKTTFSISMFFFILLGVLATLAGRTSPAAAPLFRWVWVVLPALGLLLALFLIVQFLRPFQKGHSFLARIMPGWLRHLESKVQEWDETLARFYRRSPKTVFLSFGFHFLGWIAGVFEVFLILRFVGEPVSLLTAWSIESLWILLKTGAFLIPASLGASEGISLLVCTGLGLSSASGLALALVRRARELSWVGLGLAEFSRRS